jgi:hypothetical protein
MASDEAYILENRWYKSARAQSYREPLDSGPLGPCVCQKTPLSSLENQRSKSAASLELAQCDTRSVRVQLCLATYF